MKMWFWRNSLVGWVKRSRNPTDTYGFHLTSGKYLLLLGFGPSTQPTSASRLKLWVKSPPSPCRRGVGGEVFIDSLFTHILKLDEVLHSDHLV